MQDSLKIVKPIDKPQHISLLLPTRARLEYLNKSLDSIERTVSDTNSIDVWIYVDNDDDITKSYINSNSYLRYSFKINWVLGERTISQGQMVNILRQRCTTNPGIYIPWCDDYIFTSNNWDSAIRDTFNRYPDRMTLLHIRDPLMGATDDISLPVLSAEWTNVTGRIYTEFFQFWFDDSWLDQVAQMVQRKVTVECIKVQPIGGKGKTPRLKNLPFWHRFFDNLMYERIEDANLLRRVIYPQDCPEYHQSVKEAERVAKSYTEQREKITIDSFLATERAYSAFPENPEPHLILMCLALEAKAVSYLCAKADSLIQAGDFSKALKMLNNITLAEQKYKNINYLRALCFKRLQRAEQASEAALEELRLQPEHKASQEIRRQTEEIMPDAQSPIAEAAACSSKSPQANTLNQQGEDLFVKGDIEGALNAFTKAIEVNSDLAAPHNNLGVLFWQKGQIENAVKHFVKALEIDPLNRITILNCADVFKILQRFEDARQIYSSYLKRNPDDKEIKSALLQLPQEHNASQEICRQTEKNRPDAQHPSAEATDCPSKSTQAKTLNQQGEYLFVINDLEGALNAFTRAIEIDSDFALPHNNLGVLFWKKDQIKNAVKHFIKALEIDPLNRDTISNCNEALESLQILKYASSETKALSQQLKIAGEHKADDRMIPPEIKNDEFYYTIQELVRTKNIKTILEIGSAAGDGSTEAFVTGLRDNPNRPMLYCIEASKPRFAVLKRRYADNPQVKCYQTSTVSIDNLPTEQEVVEFYNKTKTNLNRYPLEQVLDWLRCDKECVKNMGTNVDGVTLIKKENNIKNFDMVLIDGSAFTGFAELETVYGARLILLDDINDIKNYKSYKRLLSDPNYKLVKENWNLRNGYAVFEHKADDRMIPPEIKNVNHIGGNGNYSPETRGKASSPLAEQLSRKLRLLLVYSLHPVTPRITIPEWIKETLREYYAADVEVFACGPRNEIDIPDSPAFYDNVARVVKDLHIDAIWDIEGAAHGGFNFMFKRFPSSIQVPKVWWAVDTHQFLSLQMEKAKYFDLVFSAQKNALSALGPNAVWLPVGASLHEKDCQLERNIDVGFIGNIHPKLHRRRKKILKRLLTEIPNFKCFTNVFLREKAELTSRMKIMLNVSLNNDINLRVFSVLAGGAMLITDKIHDNGFEELFEDGKHLVTFETEEELIDKIHYYLEHEDERERIAKAGKERVLQQFTHRVLLQKPLGIIAGLVAHTSASSAEPHKNTIKQNVSFPDDMFVVGCKKPVRNLLLVRPDSIGDNVLAASMLPHIREKYSNAKITIVCQEHIAKLYEACPHVDNIIALNKGRFLQNEQYFGEIMNSLRTLKADLSLHSVYSRELAGDLLAIMCDAKQRIALKGDTYNILPKQKDKLDQLYTRLLPSKGKHKLELDRHRDFLRGLSIDVPSLKPMIWTTDKDEKFAEKFFEESNFKPEHTIALFAGAQQQIKSYDKYGQALSEFCKENHLNVVALGAENDRDINQRNLSSIGVKTVNLSGKTTICQSAEILRRCRLAVGADTGLAHISCAVAVPNVILLGGAHFGRFMPYSPLTSIVCLPLKCYGCNWGCRYLDSHCIKGIKLEVIAEALRQTFAKPSGKIRVFVQGESLWEPNPWQPAWSSFEEHLDIDTVEIIPVPPESSQRLDGLDHITHVLSEQLRPDAQQISADALAHPSKSTQVMTNPLEEM